MKDFFNFLKISWKKRGFYKTSWWKKFYHLFVRLGAKIWLALHPRVKVIAITGSYGKTTTTQLIYRFLGGKNKAVVTDINLDTIYNLPRTILRLRSRHRWLVLEMGVDHQGEMDFHLALVKPDLLVLTGITPVHAQEGLLGSLEGVMKEKGKAVEAVKKKNGWLVANGADKRVREMIKNFPPQRLLTYSPEGRKGDLWAEKVRITLEGTEFVLRGKTIAPLVIKGRFWGKQFVASFLAAAALGIIEKMKLEPLVKIGRSFTPLKGRMSLEKGPGGIILLNDSLRANPASVRAGLETLSFLTGKRKIALLGEMGELGRYARREHKKVGQWVVRFSPDYFIGVGPLMKLAVEEAKKEKKKGVFWANDVFEAVKILKEKIKVKRGDLVYLKGSLLRHMERVVLLLEGKKVDCRRVSCSFYHPCGKCPYRRR